MGFKSATKSQYIVDNVVFPSKRDKELINQIDQQLLKLYSPDPDDDLWPTKNESPERESIEEFNQILNNVQNLTNYLDKVELRETDDSAFAGLFHGIINFLYEGSKYEDEDFLNDRIKFNRLNFKRPIGGFFYAARNGEFFPVY